MTKRQQRLATGIGVAVLASLIALAACRYLSFLVGIENFAADIRVAALQPPTPPSKDVVVVAIDEATLSKFAYRSPVDRDFLAELLEALEGKGARLIGLDVILDQPTEPEKDARLSAAIRDLGVPLLISYTSRPEVVNETQIAYLNAFVPEHLRAEANLLTDPFDGTVRWINPGGNSASRPPGFVYKALALAGHPVATVPGRHAEIAWHSQPDVETPAFPIYPANAAAFLPDAWIKDKIVLVGATLSLTDRHRTPLAIIDDGERGMMPGVLIQAHGIAQYLEGRQAPRLPFGWTAAIVTAAAALGVLISFTSLSFVSSIGVGMAIVALFWVAGILGYAQGLPLLPLVAPTIGFLLSLWMMDILIGRAERRQREFVQGAFSRYVSPAVVDQLIDNPAAMGISGTRREATFIFTDIAGFTTLSEHLDSERLADTLNAYLDGACAIILRHEGTIDKFIGDAIMAIFNAPIEQRDHTERAVLCALDLDAYAEDFRKARNAVGIPIGVTRIGIHRGPATIGNFGSASRMDFTALGDTVNTAARTEGVNKYFGTRICCTQAVVDHARALSFRPVGDVVLKGKTQAVTLYTPAHADEDPVMLSDYAAAFALLRARSDAAEPRFADLAHRYPEDPVITFHSKRIDSGARSAEVVMEDK